MGEIERLVHHQAGVLTAAQATGAIGRAAVRTHLAQRRWRAICPGVLLTENGSLRHDQQLWVAVLAAGEGAHLAGHTAAARGGVRGLRNEVIHVLVPAARTRCRRLGRLPPDMLPVRVHRTNLLPTEHLRTGGSRPLAWCKRRPALIRMC